MKFSLLFICLIAAGCATPEQQEAARYQQEQERQAYREGLRRQCLSYGFRPESNELAQCIMQTHQRNIGLAAQIIMQQPDTRPVYQAPPIRQPTNTQCYTDRLGYTNCVTR